MTFSRITGVQGTPANIPTGTPSSSPSGPATQPLTPDAHWETASDAILGYYTHRGTLYLTGAVQPIITATGSFRTIYADLPAAIRPVSSVSLTFPLVRTGLPLLADAGLSPPVELAATVSPDGTVTLDDELWANFLSAPAAGSYWYYTSQFGSPPPTQPRYPAPFPCVVALGNASWPVSAVVDTFTTTPLGPYLDAGVADSDSGMAQHIERNHLAGAVTVVSIPQDVAMSPSPTAPVQLTDSLPDGFSPNREHDKAITTVHRSSDLWVAENDGFGGISLPQPFNWGRPSVGHSPWLISSLPTPALGETDTDPTGRNYVGYTALGLGTGDGGLSGSYSASAPTSLTLAAIFDIDALLAMVAPTPDWFALHFDFGFTNTDVDNGSGFTVAWQVAGGQIAYSGPVAGSIAGLGGLPDAFGFAVPASSAYVGTTFAPAWIAPPSGISTSYLWKTTDWPGGSITLTASVPSPGRWYFANLSGCGMTILPFWEMPETGFIESGDTIDLIGTGWEGGRAEIVPSTIFAGVGQVGALPHRGLLTGTQGPSLRLSS